PPSLRASRAVSPGDAPHAAAPAERLVYPRRPRYLESTPRKVSGPLRDHEGPERAAAELRPGRVESRAAADLSRGSSRAAAPRAHDRDDERRRATILRLVSRPGGRRERSPPPARPAPVPRVDRPSRYGHRPKGTQHGAQGLARARRQRSRRHHRLG